MCDYSLHGIASRPARIGDRLVTTRFAHAATRGFSAVDDASVAVCLLAGTEIAFDKEVVDKEVTRGHFLDLLRRWLPAKKPLGKTARFRQINLNQQHAHHDALEFPSGRIVLLTRLFEGQRATVLQLPALPQALKGSAGPVRAFAAVDRLITSDHPQRIVEQRTTA
jgi:hypothetical protein